MRCQFFSACRFPGIMIICLMSGLGTLFAADQNHWVLLSDTHIPANLKEERHGINPNDHLAQAKTEILALADKPAGVIISGDLVFLHGKTEDYQTLSTQLLPFDQASIPLYPIFGNHDNYENFVKELERYVNQENKAKGRQTWVIETPHANWFLLDTLEKTNLTPGLLGDEQLAWLEEELDKRSDKPAIIVAHHNLEKTPGALQDAPKLWKTMKTHKQVKAYIYGHTHIYRHELVDGVHLINLPAMAWRFDDKQPLGWTDVILSENGIELTLHTIDKKHEKNNDVRKYEWAR